MINMIKILEWLLSLTYLWLCDRVRVELDLAKVVAGGQELAVVGLGAGVEVGAVRSFRPDPDRVETQETRLRRPFRIADRGRVGDGTAYGSIPYERRTKLDLATSTVIVYCQLTEQKFVVARVGHDVSAVLRPVEMRYVARVSLQK